MDEAKKKEFQRLFVEALREEKEIMEREEWEEKLKVDVDATIQEEKELEVEKTLETPRGIRLNEAGRAGLLKYLQKVGQVELPKKTRYDAISDATL